MKMYSDERTVDPSQERTGWLEARQITLKEMKIAQLLAESGIVSPERVDKALAIASETHQAVESVLVAKFDLPERTLKNTFTALSMIDADLTERYIALEALYLSHVSNIEFDEVVVPKSGSQDFEFLLIKSAMASAFQLKEAKRISRERNIKLSVALLLMKAVPFTHINYALECLHLIKETRLTMEAAVTALTQVKEHNMTLQAALSEPGRAEQSVSSTHIKIGELLLGGRVVNESDMLGNVEQAIESRRLIGALLVESGLVSDQALKDVLLLQSFCTKGVVDKRGAIKLLRKAVETNEGLQVTARCLGTFSDDPQHAALAMETLIKAGFVNNRELSRAQLSFSYLEMGALRALVASGCICASARIAALECAQLQARNLISQEEAINVLHYCDRHNTSYEEAFKALGISKIEDRQKFIDHAITSEFKTNKSLAPKMHRSLHFVLMLLVAMLTIVAAIVLQNMDPCNLRGYAIPFLLFTASTVIIRIGQLWVGIARRRVKEISERQDSARVTVSRLKPAPARVASR